MFFDRLKQKGKEKDGTEIMQSIMIIAVIGAIAVTLVLTFKTQLYGALGARLKDGTYDYSTEAASGTLESTLKLSNIYNGKEKISYNN